MKRISLTGLGLVAALLASGCGTPSPTAGFADAAQRDQAMIAFRAGRARMDCGLDARCLARWFGQTDPVTRQPNANRRDYARAAQNSQNWQALAEAVLSSGIDSDLHLYYLAVAANGMGLTAPARTYLQRSIQRSRDRGGLACGATIPCDDIQLPRSAQAMLGSLTPRARVGAPAPAAAPAAEAAPEPAAAPAAPGSNWVRPVAPAADATPAPAAPAGAPTWVMPTPAAGSR